MRKMPLSAASIYRRTLAEKVVCAEKIACNVGIGLAVCLRALKSKKVEGLTLNLKLAMQWSMRF